jgi:hypothetical protein
MTDKRPVLSDVQFAHLLGGSREIATGKAGKGSGYYVSRDPRVPLEAGGSQEIRATTGSLSDSRMVSEHMRDIKGIAEKVMPTGFMQARAATPTESANVHQGIWKDPKSNETHLDVSDRIGGRASRSSLEEALSRGITQKQLGVYAAGTGRTLDTHFEDPKTGTKTVNPAAEYAVTKLKEQGERSKERRKITPKQKAAALEAFRKS